ncbi:MAG: SdpI family protein [Woeseiaceae bacterium]|nr:SdpI family protein [Woeseiaceae bacterium]
MSNKRAELLSWFFIIATIGMAGYFWPMLPDPMPSHWNVQGEVDAWMPKFWGVAVLPIAAIGLYLLFKAIPYISPKGFRTDAFREVLNIFQVTLVAFTALIALLVFLEATGTDVAMEQTVMAATGVLFLIIGNYLGKVRKNFFLGIRTPWTLASDEVWSRTNRVGGYAFMLGGIVMIVGALTDLRPDWIIGVAVVVAVYPVLHSYLLYRRIEGFGKDNGA